MICEQLGGEDILSLKEGEKDICISVIVPTKNVSYARSADTRTIEQAVQRAKGYLKQNYRISDVAHLVSSLDKLTRQAVLCQDACGFGIFISAGVEKIFHFFYPVKEKIIINNTFEIRDLLYQAQYSRPYYVLHLGHTGAELYKCGIRGVHKVGNEKLFWPYLQSECSALPNGDWFRQNRGFSDFLRKTDKTLTGYITREYPLMVSGEKQKVSAFANITANLGSIVAYLYGNHSPASGSFSDVVWTVAKEYMNEYYRKQARECIKQINNGKGAYGIRATWKAVQEGRGKRLFVERDFTTPGFLNKNRGHDLNVYPPKSEHFTISDAVDSLIELVLRKNGEVILLENEALADYQHVALVTSE